jgi:hypothetical protein
MERIDRLVSFITVCFIASCVAAGCDPNNPVDENEPPSKPTNPYPADGATEVNRILTVSWDCYDPNGDPLVFDVVLNKGIDVVATGSDLRDEYWAVPDTLEADTEYRWRVTVTEDTNNRLTAGSGEWMFTTGSIANSPPGEPFNPSPGDLATDQPTDVDLSWTCTDPDPGDTLTYDVYFGTTDAPPRVSTGRRETTYDPGNLVYSEDYYWFVVARDEYGDTTTGSTWRFRTQRHPGPAGVYAALSATRDLTWLDPLLKRVDRLTARFDNRYAPIDTIEPLRPAGVTCGQFTLEWDQDSKRYDYHQDDPDTEFLVLNGEYVYNVQAGGGVPDLSQMFVMPSCGPYVTSPCGSCDVPITGFVVEWEEFWCGGQVRLVIMDANGDSTVVGGLIPNDGSATITEDNLSSITNFTMAYYLLLIHERRIDIDAAGYDARSYISSKTVSTTPIFFSPGEPP